MCEMYRLFMFIGRINTDFIYQCKWWERGIRAIWEQWTKNNYYWERWTGNAPRTVNGNNLQWEQWTENKKEARTLHGNTPYPPPPLIWWLQNAGQVQGSSTRGELLPSQSHINFAVPRGDVWVGVCSYAAVDLRPLPLIRANFWWKDPYLETQIIT